MAARIDMNSSATALESISKQLERQDVVLASINTRWSGMVNLAKVASEVAKNEVTLTEKLSSVQSSIEAKTKEIAFWENERLHNSAAVAGMGSLIRNEQMRLLGLLKEEYAERDRINSIINKQLAGAILLEKTGLKPLVDRVKQYQDLWNKDGGVVVALAGFNIWKKTFELFKSIDDAAAEFRMQMGLTRSESEGVYKTIQELTINLTQVGVTAKIASAAAFELSKALYSSNSVSYELAENVSLMKAQLGVAEGTSAEFVKTLGMMSQTTAAAQVNMSYYAANMSKAAGVPLGEVMQDVNTAVKNSYQFITKSGVALIKAAIEARRMGTSLESATQSGRSLLNFTQNVKDEMEASVLVGKSINLQKARELAYHRDIRGLNKEILNIMKETDFENLDPFQQEAVAKALGKSAGELGNMAQAERQRMDMERSTNSEIQKGLKSYKEQMAATESIAKENGKNLAIQLRTQQNQARIAAISQTWASIMQKMSAAFLPMVLKALEGINFVLNKIAEHPNILKGLGLVVGTIGGIMLIVKAFSALKFALFGIKAASTALGGATAAGGGMLGGLFRGIGTALRQLRPADIARFAISLALLGGALYVFAKGIKPFADVKWGPVFAGVGALVVLGIAVSALGKMTTSMMKGAVGVAVLGGALWLFGTLVKPFTEINWKGMLTATLALAAVALVAGIMGAPPIIGFILMGAVAIAALGLALIPFAAAAWIASKALQNLSDVKWKDIATGIFRIGIQTPLIAGMGMAMLIAAPGIAAFSLALIPLSFIANRAGAGMMNLGAGLKMITESFGQLQNMSFIGTILQIKNLSSAIKDLSKSISAMPDISVEKLKAIALAGGGGEAAQKKDNTSEMLSAIKDAIDGLRTDFKNGAVTATVFLDSQKFDSAIGRRMIFTGALA